MYNKRSLSLSLYLSGNFISWIKHIHIWCTKKLEGILNFLALRIWKTFHSFTPIKIPSISIRWKITKLTSQSDMSNIFRTFRTFHIEIRGNPSWQTSGEEKEEQNKIMKDSVKCVFWYFTCVANTWRAQCYWVNDIIHHWF